MAEIRVTSAALRARKEELEQLNRSFMETASALEATVQSLAASWEGESHDAFYMTFKNDKNQMMNFSQAVTGYTGALETIITGYEQAEQNNLALAQARRL